MTFGLFLFIIEKNIKTGFVPSQLFIYIYIFIFFVVLNDSIEILVTVE